MDQEDVVREHEWDVAVLERVQKTARTRLLIAGIVAAPTALLGMIGLVMGGKGPIWGLASLVVAAIALSVALRQKTKYDYCRGQLDEIVRSESIASATRSIETD